MVTQKNKAAHQKAQSASPIEPDRDANKKSRATQGIPNRPVPSSGQTRQQKTWSVLPGMILMCSFVRSFVCPCMLTRLSRLSELMCTTNRLKLLFQYRINCAPILKLCSYASYSKKYYCMKIVGLLLPLGQKWPLN